LRTRRRFPLPASALAALAALLASSLAALLPACSLGNVRQDDCAADAECVTLFGLGSRCTTGFCTTPPACSIDDDCLAQFGRGSCVESVCASTCEGQRPNGALCHACSPSTTSEFYNACTSAECVPFDQKRLTKLPPDGKLPPLP
jgi:hypothetical protein